jgi:hypothetical protein
VVQCRFDRSIEFGAQLRGFLALHDDLIARVRRRPGLGRVPEAGAERKQHGASDISRRRLPL